MDALEKIAYKGHEIEIWFDEVYDENPNDWDDGIILVFYHRDFWISADNVITEDDVRRWFLGEKIEQEDKYYMFPVSALIHSGIALSLSSYFMEDPGRWDTSTAGAILVSKEDAGSRKEALMMARDEISDWNDILSGQVFGYTIDGMDGVWGYIGDKQIAIDEAKSAVDVLFRKRERKIKSLIRHHVNLSKRLKILEAI